MASKPGSKQPTQGRQLLEIPAGWGTVTSGNTVFLLVCNASSVNSLQPLTCADYGNTMIPLYYLGLICVTKSHLVFLEIWVFCKDTLDSKGERSKFKEKRLKERVCAHALTLRQTEGKRR